MLIAFDCMYGYTQLSIKQLNITAASFGCKFQYVQQVDQYIIDLTPEEEYPYSTNMDGYNVSSGSRPLHCCHPHGTYCGGQPKPHEMAHADLLQDSPDLPNAAQTTQRYLPRSRGSCHLVLLCSWWFAKDTPEAQCLISTSRHDAGAIRAGCHVQHPALVPSQLTNLDQAGILPQTELVLAVAVAAENLALMPVPLQGADLGAGINGAEHGTCVGVPELDAAISCTTASGDEVALERAPCQCLDCCLVGVDLVKHAEAGVKNAQVVVVATTGQLLATV